MYSVNYKFEVPDACGRVMEVKKGDEDMEKKMDTSIAEHHFNSKIILQFPDTSLPSNLNSTLCDETCFYLVKNLPVQELCENKFTEAFVNYGKVYAYSINTRLDIDDCAAFTPNGTLFLLLDNFIYHELGIAGKLSSSILRKPVIKYFVEVDTKAQGFTPSKKLYQRTHQALAACPLRFDFYLTWTPHDDNVCPSSVAKYFHDLEYEVEEIYPHKTEVNVHDVRIPQIVEEPGGEVDYVNILEWVGAMPLNIKEKSLKIPTTNSSSVCPLLNVSTTEGFFTPCVVQKIIKILRTWLDEKNPTLVPWINITVYGPPDCLVSWSRSENTFKTNGDNFYSLFLLRDRTLFFTVEESKKPQRFYVKTSNNKR